MNPFTIEEYQQFYLNEDKLQKCYEEKWFKMFVPKSCDGLQLSMKEGCRELLNIAEFQGGLGWTVNLGAGANWFTGFFEEKIAKELFTPENAVIAGSGYTNWECYRFWLSTEEDKLVNWAYCDMLTTVQHYMVKP